MAVKAAAEMGVWMVNIALLRWPAHDERLPRVLGCNGPKPLIGVTVLTSGLSLAGIGLDIEPQVPGCAQQPWRRKPASTAW